MNIQSSHLNLKCISRKATDVAVLDEQGSCCYSKLGIALRLLFFKGPARKLNDPWIT